MEIVEGVNKTALEDNDALKAELGNIHRIERITEERHGAIRLGTEQELHTMRRLFAVMGMEPVGYYDLSVASIPVQSTAFWERTT